MKMMKKLGLFTLGLFAASQLACVESGGVFNVSWDVTLDGVQVAASCAEANNFAVTMGVLVTDSLGQGTDISLTCDYFSGSTARLPFDDYVVTYDILDDGNPPILIPEGFGEGCIVAGPAPTPYPLDASSVMLPTVVFDFVSDTNPNTEACD